MPLNRSDCEKVFAKLNPSGDNKLVDYKLEPFCKDSKKIRGYFGEHLLLTLNGQNGEDYTFFVKVIQSDNDNVKLIEDIPVFEKEVYVYKFIEKVKAIMPELEIHMIPKLMFCKVTGTTKVMVCENASVQGFQGSQNLKLTYDETIVGLKALAKYHTVSIVFEQLMKKQNNGISIPEYCNDAKLMHPLFTKDEKSSGYKYFRSAESGILELAKIICSNESLQQQIKDSCNELLDLLNEPNDFCNVLSHGDMWAFNLLFKYDKATDKAIDAKIIDFQFCRYAPPAHDVTMFLICATDENSRKKYLGQFFQFYYKCLREELAVLGFDIKNILSVNEYEETCKLYMPLAKFTWLCYRQLADQSQESAIEMQNNYEYMFYSVIESGRPALIRRLFEIDAPFVKSITKIFKEYLEIFDFKPLTVEEVYIFISKMLSKLYLGEVPDYDLIDYSPQYITKMGGYCGISITVKVLSCQLANDLITLQFFTTILPKTKALCELLEDSLINIEDEPGKC